MSKQIANNELAEIVTGLLIDPKRMGELDSPESYLGFMESIGKAVADYCGGEVIHATSGEGEQPLLAVAVNDSLPSLRNNVWAPYDDVDAWDESEAADAGIDVGTPLSSTEIVNLRTHLVGLCAQSFIDYRLELMSVELTRWQKEQNLPVECAVEQYHTGNLTDAQSAYLYQFIQRWEKLSEGVIL